MHAQRRETAAWLDSSIGAITRWGKNQSSRFAANGCTFPGCYLCSFGIPPGAKMRKISWCQLSACRLHCLDASNKIFVGKIALKQAGTEIYSPSCCQISRFFIHLCCNDFGYTTFCWFIQFFFMLDGDAGFLKNLHCFPCLAGDKDTRKDGINNRTVVLSGCPASTTSRTLCTSFNGFHPAG